MKKKSIARSIFLAITITICFIAGYAYLKQSGDNFQTTEVANIDNELLNIVEPLQSNQEKISQLQANYQNPDIKAILSIDNIENFSYPVAQTTNNEYYLNHNYKRESDTLGAIYTDYRVDLETSPKILIYGHSSTKTEVPFNQLENYYDEKYYQNHKYITLETNSNTYRYEIFSVYVETSDFTYMNMNFESTEDWYFHILKLQKKSQYQTNVNLTKDDNILIMQTCSNHPDYQSYSKKYLLIVSRRG